MQSDRSLSTMPYQRLERVDLINSLFRCTVCVTTPTDRLGRATSCTVWLKSINFGNMWASSVDWLVEPVPDRVLSSLNFKLVFGLTVLNAVLWLTSTVLQVFIKGDCLDVFLHILEGSLFWLVKWMSLPMCPLLLFLASVPAGHCSSSSSLSGPCTGCTVTR